MSFLIRIPTLAVLILASGMGIAAATTCNEYLDSKRRSNYVERIDQLLTSQTSEKLRVTLEPEIRTTLGRSSELQTDQVLAVFNLYMEARISLLPFDVQAKIRKTMADGTKISTFTPRLLTKEIGGGVREVLGFINLKISMPNYLFETLVDYAVRVHELEHVIQIHMVGSGSADNPYYLNFVSHRYAMEMGSIRAEGTFLSLFPAKLVRVELDRLESRAISGTKTSVLAKRMLSNSLHSNSVDDYIKLTTDQGRYSRSQLRRGQIITYAIFPGGAIPFFSLAHIFGW